MELAFLTTSTLESGADQVPTGTPRFVSMLRMIAFVALLGGAAASVAPTPAPSAVQPNAIATTFAGVSQELSGPEDRFAALRVQWTFADARPLSEETIGKAKLLLDELPGNYPQPQISPSSEGEIGFSWIDGTDRFEAMLDPDDRLVWITKIAGKFARGGDVNVASADDRESFYAGLGNFYERA